MAGEAAKHKVNIGLTSLILIFIILCLSTFCLLSLSSARGDLSLAERKCPGSDRILPGRRKREEWLKQADAVLQKETAGKSMSQEEIQSARRKTGRQNLAVM